LGSYPENREGWSPLNAHLGVGRQQIRRVSVVGVVLAAFIFVVGLVGGSRHSTLVSVTDYASLIGSSVLIGAILPIVLLFAAVLQLEVTDGDVLQALWGRWLVTRKPLSELTHIDTRGRMFPLVLTFRDGSKMRVVGAPLRDIPPFVQQLVAHAPQARLDSP
jgi:hypothetical protein